MRFKPLLLLCTVVISCSALARPATAVPDHGLTNTFSIANSKNSSYLELNASFDLGQGWSLAPHVGRQQIDAVASGLTFNL